MTDSDEPVSLKELTRALVEALRGEIRALEKHVDQLFVAHQKAVDVASKELTIRLDHSNGLIEQLKEQATVFARHDNLDALAARVGQLEQLRAAREGQLVGNKPIRDLAMVVIGAVLTFVLMKFFPGAS